VIRIAQQAARGAAGDCVFPGLRRSLWQSPRLRERAVLGESRRPSRSHGSRGRRPAAASSASLGGSTSSPLDALQPRGLEIAFHRVGQRRSGCGATGSLRVVDGRRLMRAGTEPRALRRSRARRGSRSPAAMGGQSFGNSPRMLCTPASLVGAVVAEVRVQRCQDDTATSERVAKGCVPRELIGCPPRRSGEGRSLSSITHACLGLACEATPGGNASNTSSILLATAQSLGSSSISSSSMTTVQARSLAAALQRAQPRGSGRWPPPVRRLTHRPCPRTRAR
jgi:hypothetical protein